MKSTFKVLFYVKKQSVKNGKAPVMGRITINGTQAGFSCKKEVSLALWDVKTNRDRKSTRLNSSHLDGSRMPSSA